MWDTRQSLTAFQQTISEQVLAILVQDNVDVACAAIEKAAMERAVTDVDEGFAASYEARRRYREVYYLAFIPRLQLTSTFQQHRSGQAFWDPAAPPSNFSASLPDPLRIKPTGLQPHQAAVYEDFGTLIIYVSKWLIPIFYSNPALDSKRGASMSRPSSTVSYARNEHLNPALYAASPASEQAIASHTMSHQEAMERFTVSMPSILHYRKSDYCVQTILRDLEGLIIQLPIQSLAALPPNHDLRHLVRQILFVATSSIDHNRTPLHMSQKIVQLLYKTSSQLGREIYVALLDQLCRTFEDVAKEAITWLLYAEDEVYFKFLL
jgi:CCR4-NOT transcription complex subunit 1